MTKKRKSLSTDEYIILEDALRNAPTMTETSQTYVFPLGKKRYGYLQINNRSDKPLTQEEVEHLRTLIMTKLKHIKIERKIEEDFKNRDISQNVETSHD